MRHDEQRIQAEIVLVLRLMGYFVFYVPNDAAGRTSLQRGARLKRLGLYAGMSDLIVIMDDGRAVFLEVKTEKGRRSKSQDEFMTLCYERGWSYGTVRDAEGAINFLKMNEKSC